MKTRIFSIILLSIICCTTIASNADVRSIERDLKKVQNEISQLTSQKKAAETKLQKAEADFQKATAKMEENKDKPKSLPYKNAVKKVETSQQKVEELRSSLQTIESDLQAKNDELLNYQQALLSAQQAQEDNAAAKKQAKEDDKRAKQLAKDSAKIAKQKEKEEKQRAKEECAAKQRENDRKYQNEETTPIYKNDNISDSKKVSATTSTDSSNKESKELSFWEWMILIGICIVSVWIFWAVFKAHNRCPKCGKWFPYHQTGLKVVNKVRKKYGTGNYGYIITYEKTFKCDCGHVRHERGQLNTSNDHLPESWYMF